MEKTINIQGMTCKHCVMHVSNALKEIEGVSSVQVSLENKQAVVETTDIVTDEQLIEAVTETGYKVTNIK